MKPIGVPLNDEGIRLDLLVERLEDLLDSFVNNGLVGCSILVSKENIEQLYYHTGSKDIENNRDV